MRLTRFSTLILVGILCGCASQKESDANVMTNQELEAELLKQQKEWEAMKPQLERILALEADLKLLVESLDAVPESSEALTQQTVTSSHDAASSNTTLANEPPILPSSALINIESGSTEPDIQVANTDGVSTRYGKAESATASSQAQPPSTQNEQARTASNSADTDSSNIEPVRVQFYQSSKSTPRTQQTSVSHSRTQFGVQLASYLSFRRAETEWQAISTRHADLVGRTTPVIGRSKVKGNTYYRLIIGPFNSKSQAAKFCTQLKNRRQDCVVAAYIGEAI